MALPPRPRTAVGKKVTQASPRFESEQAQNLPVSAGNPSTVLRLPHARPNSGQSPDRSAESACWSQRRASSRRPACAVPGGAGTVARRRLLHASLKVRPAPNRGGTSPDAATLTHARTSPPEALGAKYDSYAI